MVEKQELQPTRYIFMALVVSILVPCFVALYIYLGSLVAWSVAVPALLALAAWLATTINRPAEPRQVIVIYILAIIALLLQNTEAWLFHYPEQITEMFRSSFPGSSGLTDRVFLAIFTMGTAGVYLLGGFALCRRHPLGNYMAWFIFIFAILGGLALYIEPLVRTGAFHYLAGQVMSLLSIVIGIYGIRRLYGGFRRGAAHAGEVAK